MADVNTNTIIMDGPQKFVASFVHTYVDTGESTPVKKIDVSTLSKNPVNGNDCIGVYISHYLSPKKGASEEAPLIN